MTDLDYAHKVAKAVYITAEKAVAEDISKTILSLIADVKLATPPGSNYEPYAKVLSALRASWDFIENVSEDDPDRSEKFFALREQVRGALPTPSKEPSNG